MPIEKEYKYLICDGIKYTQSEEKKMINLLKDVRANVALLRPDVESQRLDAILEVVEDGKWILQDLNVLNRKAIDSIKQVELNYNIDLSQAKQLVDKYRHNSEGGCQSCKKLHRYMPLQDEHVFYCGKYEEKDVIGSGNSPRIEKFHKTGCDDKEIIFPKTIEEILKNYKEEN